MLATVRTLIPLLFLTSSVRSPGQTKSTSKCRTRWCANSCATAPAPPPKLSGKIDATTTRLTALLVVREFKMAG